MISEDMEKYKEYLKEAVENMTGLHVTDVDIRIVSVDVQKR